MGWMKTLRVKQYFRYVAFSLLALLIMVVIFLPPNVWLSAIDYYMAVSPIQIIHQHSVFFIGLLFFSGLLMLTMIIWNWARGKRF